MYKSKLSLLETQRAIQFIKDKFAKEIAQNLNLVKISGPLFIDPSSGLNDGLSGSEEAVSFVPKYLGKKLEVVHSLAKWKRYILHQYELSHNQGIYTDMLAIRKDEKLSAIHSFLVDQWDWEKIILRDERKLEYLFITINKIYQALKETEAAINQKYPVLAKKLPAEIYFIDSQELENCYPERTAKERENIITKEKRAVFIFRIGIKLESGDPHDQRAVDYDDWNLNGDLLVYSDILNQAVELSSMGIRVDSHALIAQSGISKIELANKSFFHNLVVHEKVPFTIGGGIGQSRLCLFLLEKQHIAEVQVGYWEQEIPYEL